VIVIAVAASGFAISQQAAQAFMAIMTRYHVDPATIAAEFHTSSRRIFVVSTLVAATIAMLLGWALMTRIVRPLKLMMMLAERIAQGDYARHVDVRGRDEIARLAESLNQMAASLHRIEGLRRDLVANVAHELRLVRLVDDLHQLSQFDARVLRLRTGPLDLPMLVGRLVSVYRPEFARRGLDLIEAHDDGLPSVEADGDLVDRALRNLIDNALRYAPSGATVTVEARRDGGVVRLAVSNTGEGIAPEDVPRIFERFYRGEKSRSRETGGAGIGLSIVQEIARAHGGETGARSADGLTSVWFRLPLGADAQG
jgi:signal transduction histidine kinase